MAHNGQTTPSDVDVELPTPPTSSPSTTTTTTTTTTTATAATKKSRRTTKSLACDSCRSGKRKCVWPDSVPPPSSTVEGPRPPSLACTRCQRVGISCVVSLPRKKRGRPRKRRLDAATSSSGSSSATSSASSLPPGGSQTQRSQEGPETKRFRTLLLGEEKEGGAGPSSAVTHTETVTTLSATSSSKKKEAEGESVGWAHAMNDLALMGMGSEIQESVPRVPFGTPVGLGPLVVGREMECSRRMLGGFRNVLFIIPPKVELGVEYVLKHNPRAAISLLPMKRVSPVLEVIVRMCVAGGAMLAGDRASGEVLVEVARDRSMGFLDVISEEAAVALTLLGMWFMDGTPELAHYYLALANRIVQKIREVHPERYCKMPHALEAQNAPVEGTTESQPYHERPLALLKIPLTKLYATVTHQLGTRVLRTCRPTDPGMATLPLVHMFVGIAQGFFPLFSMYAHLFQLSGIPCAREAGAIMRGYLGDAIAELRGWDPDSVDGVAGVGPKPEVLIRLRAVLRNVSAYAGDEKDLEPEEFEARLAAFRGKAGGMLENILAQIAVTKTKAESFENGSSIPVVAIVTFALQNVRGMAKAMMGEVAEGMDEMHAALLEMLDSSAMDVFFHLMGLNIRALATLLWFSTVFPHEPLYCDVLPVANKLRSRVVHSLVALAQSVLYPPPPPPPPSDDLISFPFLF